MKATKVFTQFFENEKASGLLLIAVTLISLLLANSVFQESYVNFWKLSLGSHSLVDWINDGLMAIFFLLIGLELEREIYAGELSNLRKASLPLFGALGGMLVPAGLYLAFNWGTATQSGAGIPMATDIAFAVGALSLLGKKVPTSLKIFLTALAVVDDLGAILVIAIFYTKSLAFFNLAIALAIFGGLLVCNRMRIHSFWPYAIGGIAMWYFMLHSGIHATIAGVLLAFALPFGKGDKTSISYRWQQKLHLPVGFIILPLFALANTCLPLSGSIGTALLHPSSLGIILGLVIGKPLGIFLFAYGTTQLGWSHLPNDLRWKQLFGAGILGGIGFTMSIFISLLAFQDEAYIEASKIAILLASTVAGIVGFLYLKRSFQS
ncbi:MAG: Na+/H+ antiporter NhaA [Flavobacterium sp.]|nr:Na+/H+ antiporter NhaA [Flavobacterium sp.]